MKDNIVLTLYQIICWDLWAIQSQLCGAESAIIISHSTRPVSFFVCFSFQIATFFFYSAHLIFLKFELASVIK